MSIFWSCRLYLHRRPQTFTMQIHYFGTICNAYAVVYLSLSLLIQMRCLSFKSLPYNKSLLHWVNGFEVIKSTHHQMASTIVAFLSRPLLLFHCLLFHFNFIWKVQFSLCLSEETKSIIALILSASWLKAPFHSTIWCQIEMTIYMCTSMRKSIEKVLFNI